ncbi:MAG TPA: hypothetical protein VK856_16280 [Anaerolineaceae bacterium]|nr:hypothetical protein [Anaerolineaceae bacterium]
MELFGLKNKNLLKNIQSLSFIKATAWVILGISSMFATYDLASVQSEELWLSNLIKFGLAIAFLLAGIFLQKEPKKNIYLLLIVILVDVVVSIQSPIGIFDILMIFSDLIIYWLIFQFFRTEKI